MVGDHERQQNGPRYFGRTPGCGRNPEMSINTVSKDNEKD